ncbi:Regulator of drug sensitivity 2 [Pseudozyma hubeiensis]|nr:Regulator of drug sensitivity 2 [Pseudozyma hubeiensis]
MTPPPPAGGASASASSSQPFDPRSLYSSSSPSNPKQPATTSNTNSIPAPPVKREPSNSHSAHDDADDSSPSASSPAGGKKKPSKRRKVNLACIYCRRSHMTCDEGRPCQRCIKRDIGHLCHDEATPAKAGDKDEQQSGAAVASSTPSKPAKAKPPAIKAASPSTTSTSTASTAPNVQEQNASTSANIFPTLGLAGSATPANAVFGSSSAGPYSSMNSAPGEFNAANMFKPQAQVGGGATMQQTGASSGGNAAGLIASLFNNDTNNNNGIPSQSVQANQQQQQQVGGEMTGLGGAGWLGLGGGPGGYEGGGSGFGGDSAGGNEFTLLSEFLESLDGPGFGAGATPGMSGTSAIGAGTGSGFTPSQSRRNTISGLGGMDGLTALTPINGGNAAVSSTAAGGGAGSMYNSGSFGSGVINATNSNTGDTGSGKRSRRSSFSAAPTAGASSSNTSSALASGSYIPSLQGGSTKQERFFLTAADQKDGTRDERLARVIQAKYEAGLLRPYNHVNGYARLNRWMERNVSAASKRRILKPLSVFRPAFRAVAQSLTTIDLVFIEEAFERLLLDYDRVFSTQGIPACLWRRTGEIYKGNKEFAELVGVPIESLREGRLCIYELMAEESAVNYWEKYGAVSFDPGQKAVLTSCVLRTKNKSIVANSGRDGKKGGGGQQTEGGDVAAGTGATSTSGVLKDPTNPKAAFIHCCFSFTIRRDQWNIPHLIVGNFLPTNPT